LAQSSIRSKNFLILKKMKKSEANVLTDVKGHEMSVQMFDALRGNKQVSNSLFGMPFGKFDTPEEICNKIEVAFSIRQAQLSNMQAYYTYNLLKLHDRPNGLQKALPPAGE
jgi:hypothetical protein